MLDDICKGKESECHSVLCPVGRCNEIYEQKSDDKPYLTCSKNTQHVGTACYGSKFNVEDDFFDDNDGLLDDELLDDDNDDYNFPISNFEDEKATIEFPKF